MIAKSGCGASKPSRGRFILLFRVHRLPTPSHPLWALEGGGGGRKMMTSTVIFDCWYMAG